MGTTNVHESTLVSVLKVTERIVLCGDEVNPSHSEVKWAEPVHTDISAESARDTMNAHFRSLPESDPLHMCEFKAGEMKSSFSGTVGENPMVQNFSYFVIEKAKRIDDKE